MIRTGGSKQSECLKGAVLNNPGVSNGRFETFGIFKTVGFDHSKRLEPNAPSMQSVFERAVQNMEHVKNSVSKHAECLELLFLNSPNV